MAAFLNPLKHRKHGSRLASNPILALVVEWSVEAI
jgi:hypothetical protein